MKRVEVIGLVAGRALALLGALLLLFVLLQPWATVRVSSAQLPEDVRLALSGSDMTALGGMVSTVTPKLNDLVDQFEQLVPGLSSERDFRQAKSHIQALRQNVRPLATWVAAMWLLPTIAAVLALVLLAAHGQIRFRRGWGGLVALLGLLSLIALVLTRWRVDGALAAVRAAPELADLFDAMDQAGVTVSLQTDQAITLAPILAGLVLLGGLIEAALPLSWLTRPAVRMQPTPALQAAGPVLDLPMATPPAPVRAAGERVPCVKCGRSLAAGARFCGGCGARQE